ncbi:hypothetical protein [Pseudactinotalea sp. HY158]|uniref:hypothetical protein n=1 Tax=Pseudactinotalea sp. HY158 TaxID=2654547 RepID=UPI00129C64EB|nr:hypothetical protein [Pseudactinotalea sp. HY158]QGH70717.1 hypothetical protein GCE65_15355 [Pseudactinotalea sp. HY158]
MTAIHLLLLAEDVSAAELEALALSRVHQVFRPDPRTLAWSGAVTCTGPRPPAPADHVPGWVRHVVEFRVPAERGGPIPPELRTAGSILAAFPDGEPIGLERDTVELIMAFARRLGGAVRTSTGRLVGAPPIPDLLLFSDTRLEPAAARAALAPFVTVRGDDAAGPPPRPTVPEVVEHGLDDGHRRWLHAEADAFDAHALAEPGPGSESYSVHAPQADGGLVVLTVDEAPVTPIVVADAAWAGATAYVYEVRYYAPPPVPELEPQERAAWLAAQEESLANPAVVAVIENCAWAVRSALGGVERAIVCDDDGFLVTLG